METPIEIRDLSFSYGPAPVLAHCSLTIAPGQAVILSGENGAGKSTLLKLVLGELVPQQGDALLFGTPAHSFTDWHRVGYVPQRAGGSALQALELVGLVDHANSLIGELSGGQQQRALLARALVNHPELLVLDEPTSGLDRSSVDEFIEVMATLMRDPERVVLMVSHDLERLEGLEADRIVLSQGVIHHA